MTERTQMQHALDPGNLEGQAETIERLTRERDRYKAALQSIICNKAIEGEALLHQAIARDALEQSAPKPGIMDVESDVAD